MQDNQQTTETTEAVKQAQNEAAAQNQPAGQFGQAGQNGERGGRPGGRRDRQGGRFGQNKQKQRRADDEFDTRILDIRRVSRMYKGGRRMRMSVFVVVGDRKGRVGVGLGKGADVALAQSKATEKAKKSLMMISLKGNTIPHEVLKKHRASRVLLKPAAPGTGLIAGATVKAILEVAGVKDILSKIMGSTNSVNTAYATIESLKGLRATRL